MKEIIKLIKFFFTKQVKTNELSLEQLMTQLPLEKELFIVAYKTHFKYMSKEEIETKFIELLTLFMTREEVIKQLLKDKVTGEVQAMFNELNGF